MNLTQLSEIIWIVLLVIVGVQLLYHWIVFRAFVFAKPKNLNNFSQGVSVVVCAKNEAENLKKNLPLLFNQSYPEFQVVVINDRSYDDSIDVLEEMALGYPQLKIVNVAHNENFWGNKKYALTLGIKAAKYPYLVFIDADCVPKSKNWLQLMSNAFAQDKVFVLGYGAYNKTKGFVNKLVRYETVLTAIQYFGWGLFGNPYMGVGRNMGYQKHFFLKNGGFKNHLRIMSGDDDLFVNEYANKNNTHFCFDEAAFTVSEPHTTLSSWFYQKRRHLLSAKHYKFKDKLLLSLFYIVNAMFYSLVLVLILLGFDGMLLSIPVGLKLISTYVIYGMGASKLKEKDLIWLIPFMELFLIVVQLNLFINNIFSKPLYWKPKNS